MEHLPMPHETTPQDRETTPINTARYLDQLDDQYENYWLMIMAQVQDAGINVVDAMKEVWENPQMPQAFRDRAMIVTLGDWNLGKRLGVKGRHGNWDAFYLQPTDEDKTPHDHAMGGFPGMNRAKSADAYNYRPEVASWLSETFEYQQATGETLIPEQLYLNWWCVRYENAEISAGELSDNLRKIDIQKASPREDSGGHSLYHGRFPLLDDILNDRTAGGERLKEWARLQAKQWLDAQQDNQDTADWYATARPESGVRLFRQHFTLDEAWPAIQKFGWDTYLTQSPFDTEPRIELQMLVSLLNQTTNPDMQTSLLRYLRDKRLAPPKTEFARVYGFGRTVHIEAIPLLKAVADHSQDQTLINWVNDEHKRAAEVQAEHEARRAEDEERSARRRKEAELAAQTASQKLSGLLSVIQRAANSQA